jgi:hypothetical protein
MQVAREVSGRLSQIILGNWGKAVLGLITQSPVSLLEAKFKSNIIRFELGDSYNICTLSDTPDQSFRSLPAQGVLFVTGPEMLRLAIVQYQKLKIG